MTYHITPKLSGIYSFEILDNKIISINRNATISMIDGGMKLWEVQTGNTVGFLQVAANNIIFQGNNGSIKIISISGGHIVYENSIDSFRLPVCNNLIITYRLDINTLKRENGIFDLNLRNTVWTSKEYKRLSFVGQRLLSVDLESISLLENCTGQKIWRTQLNRNGKILSFLGVHKNVLVVCLQFGNAYGLMGLDIQTGEILWNRDDWGLLQGHHITLQNGKIFNLKGGTFSDSYYLEADIDTVSLLRFGEVPNLKKHGFSIFNYTLHGNLIYFTANKLGTTEATSIGILDYESLELLWYQEVELQNGAFFGLSNKPVIDGNKLYILDTVGILHIFERET